MCVCLRRVYWCAFLCLCMYSSTRKRAHLCVFLETCVCLCKSCMSVCMHDYMCDLDLCVCVRGCVCLHVSMCVPMFMCACVGQPYVTLPKPRWYRSVLVRTLRGPPRLPSKSPPDPQLTTPMCPSPALLTSARQRGFSFRPEHETSAVQHTGQRPALQCNSAKWLVIGVIQRW